MKRELEPTEEIDGEIAHDYMKFSQWRRATYSVVAYDVYEKLGKGFSGKILEIGCAGGFLVEELHKLFPTSELTGIDVSGEMIKIAKSNYNNIKNVNFSQASVYSLPFNKEHFDLVICQGSLHHFYKVEEAVKEMLRVLKKDGFIYIQDLRRDIFKKNLQEKLESMKDDYQKERELKSIKASLTKNEINKLMKKLKIKNYEFKEAVFSKDNTENNKQNILKSRFNEINDMKNLEYILWIKKS